MPWDTAAAIAVPLAAGATASRASRLNSYRVVRTLAPFLTEGALMFALYALWQRVGEVSILDAGGAMRRGEQIWRIERFLHIANEPSIERATLHSSALMQFCNVYYAVAHVTVALAVLIWMFVRHRPLYSPFRNVLALVTGASLLVQLVPVAPPRMFPQFGFVDAAEVFHQSVYDALGRGDAGQLAAMPSVHVAWCVLVAWAVWRAAPKRWRWLGIGHAAVTSYAVVATANHWWLDGLVAVAMLVGCIVVERWARVRFARRTEPRGAVAEREPASALVP